MNQPKPINNQFVKLKKETIFYRTFSRLSALPGGGFFMSYSLVFIIKKEYY